MKQKKRKEEEKKKKKKKKEEFIIIVNIVNSFYNFKKGIRNISICCCFAVNLIVSP